MEAIKLCRLDTPIIFIEARINLSRFVVTGCAAKTSATVTFPSLNLISLFAFCFRSEERRVGKECRSRWEACYEKKNEEARVVWMSNFRYRHAIYFAAQRTQCVNYN